jgi:alkaline phosphatase D
VRRRPIKDTVRPHGVPVRAALPAARAAPGRVVMSLLRLVVYAVVLCLCGCGNGEDAGKEQAPGPVGSSLSFQFVQLSDIHIGKGPPHQEDNLRRAVSQINELGAAMVLLTGDLTDDGATAEYADLKDILSSLSAPYTCVPGDNDIVDGQGDLARYREELGADYTFFDFEGYRFIGLNDTALPLDAEQMLWLEGALGEGSPAIVFGHLPLLNADQEFEPYPTAADLLELLETHGTILYLAGHEHLSAEATRNGTVHVWCDNLSYFDSGEETYNLFKVYTDRIELYHVFFDGTAQFVARLPPGPAAAPSVWAGGTRASRPATRTKPMRVPWGTLSGRHVPPMG